MFTIAFKYILKRLLVTFFIVSPIIILMTWIVMSVKYISLIVSDDLSFGMFLKLVLCVSPGVCGIILPICFLISSIIAVYTLQSDKELVVFMASGANPNLLLSPILLLGICVTAIVLLINTVGAPSAYKTFENLKEKLQTRISTNFLSTQAFTTIGNSVIYVGSRSANALHNIFISYISERRNSNTIIARHGAVVAKDKHIYIKLLHGYRQELDKNNEAVATLSFDELTYDITDLVTQFYEKSSKVKFKTQTELMRDYKTSNDAQHKMNCLSEFHSRLTIPFVSIINALIVGLLLLSPQARGRGRNRAIVAFLCGTACYAGIMILINGNTKILYNYVTICALSVFLYISFLKYRN